MHFMTVPRRRLRGWINVGSFFTVISHPPFVIPRHSWNSLVGKVAADVVTEKDVSQDIVNK